MQDQSAPRVGLLDYSKWDSLSDGSDSGGDQPGFQEVLGGQPPEHSAGLLEVLGGRPPPLSTNLFIVGNNVRVKPNTTPRFLWGGVKAESSGVVSAILSPKTVAVDFPEQRHCKAHIDDLIKVSWSPRPDTAVAGIEGWHGKHHLQELHIGAAVKIVGLKRAVKLNGCRGVIAGRPGTPESVRWQVEVQNVDGSVEMKLMMPDNVVVQHSPCGRESAAGKQSDGSTVFCRKAAAGDSATSSYRDQWEDVHVRSKDKAEAKQLPGNELKVGCVVFIAGLKNKSTWLNGRHAIVRSLPDQSSATVELHTSISGSETRTVPCSCLKVCCPSGQLSCKLLEDAKVACAADSAFRTAVLFSTQASAQEAAVEETKKLSDSVASLQKEVQELSHYQAMWRWVSLRMKDI